MSNNRGSFGNQCRIEETGWQVRQQLTNPWQLRQKRKSTQLFFCRISSFHSNFGGFMNLEISKGILKDCGCGCPFSRIHDFCVGFTMLFVNDHEKGGDNHVGGYYS